MIMIRQITGACTPESELIGDLVRVFCEARREHLQFLMDLHDEHDDRHFLSGTMLPQNQVWVADVDGRLAGFIAFAEGWVNHLYIAPEFQRRGLGRQLLDLAKQSNSALQLWVFEVNTPAISFYENQGFRIIERTTGAANEAKQPDVRMQWQR